MLKRRKIRWSRREFVGAASATAMILPSAARAAEVLTPEAFGARGDGRTNDTEAFAALSAHVNAAGGGAVALRRVTYIVGKHLAATGGDAAFAFTPSPILHFAGCTGPVVVRGNGAVLRAQSGLRFGSFDPSNGRPVDRGPRFYDRRFRASPYIAMVHAERCSGGIDIADLELDGNLRALQVGGPWGGVQWQLPGCGIFLVDNSCAERLSEIHSHHHPLDGLEIDGLSERSTSSTISNCVFDANARQGCSIVGGRNYAFQRCTFSRTGKGGLRSDPSAGVDIEPEQKTVRKLSFTSCEFSDNSGVGLVAEAGDSEGATFDSCTFVGTTAWAAWPNKAGFRFRDCTFVGASVHPYGSADPKQAAQFANCRFLDDPALSPTGAVYGGTGDALPIVALPNSPNARFDGCSFHLVGKAEVPWSNYGVIYSNCTMSQRSPAASYPRGTYFGTTVIDGNAMLERSVIRGTVILNGRTLPRSA